MEIKRRMKTLIALSKSLYVFLNFFDIFGKIVKHKFITEAKDFCVFFGFQYKTIKYETFWIIRGTN